MTADEFNELADGSWKYEIERLTTELDKARTTIARMNSMESEHCADLEQELLETKDLANHWAIAAKQAQMELAECRKFAFYAEQALGQLALDDPRRRDATKYLMRIIGGSNFDEILKRAAMQEAKP